jgi:type IV secretion system protein VirB10
LFSALEARRAVVTSPNVTAPQVDGAAQIAPPPPLQIPDLAPIQPDQSLAQFIPAQRQAPVAPSNTRPTSRPRDYAGSAYAPAPQYSQPASFAATPAPPSPAFAYQEVPREVATGAMAGADKAKDERAFAERLANPATTIPKGTLIQAVLETAIDSNRPGFARAIVSRDVIGFDGSRVLIPKGSKLFGEYKADLAQGQNRALVEWQRLTRPDGVLIELDSPSADPLGRAGIKGKVNSHFFARFGGAILQSVLDVGVQVAARRASGDAVIILPPGTTEGMVARRPEEIKPTLTVKHGTAVSVFVMRDLDFTAVEN